MKTKLIPLVSGVMLLSLAMFSVASAEDSIALSANANVNAQSENRGNSTSTTSTTSTTERNDTENNNDRATSSEKMEATTTEENNGGQLTADEHRSTVASFVKSLLNVADREGGIGEQVRVLAKSQNDSASTSAEAIAKINNRGGFQTFLIGTDYSSIGDLRAEIATTQNNIDQLKNLMDQATSATDKAELAAQIKVLEDSQAKLDLFVKTNENSFSLFGWFSKMFAK